MSIAVTDVWQRRSIYPCHGEFGSSMHLVLASIIACVNINIFMIIELTSCGPETELFLRCLVCSCGYWLIGSNLSPAYPSW